jgi:hypothetical protein
MYCSPDHRYLQKLFRIEAFTYPFRLNRFDGCIKFQEAIRFVGGIVVPEGRSH